jgi:hypothetical protein
LSFDRNTEESGTEESGTGESAVARESPLPENLEESDGPAQAPIIHSPSPSGLAVPSTKDPSSRIDALANSFFLDSTARRADPAPTNCELT